MGRQNILIFGESQTGDIQNLLFLNNLYDLALYLGGPTPTGLGIHMAIQAMLFHYDLFFYKVTEEGNHIDQYLFGLSLFKKKYLNTSLAAIGLPGIGKSEVFEAVNNFTIQQKSVIILNEKDLYDFMTQSNL